MLNSARRLLVGTVVALVCTTGSAAATVNGISRQAGTPEICAEYGYHAGFRATALVKAIAIGMAESGCYTHAVGPNPQDQGMWQIRASPERVAQYGDLLDPANNARAAFDLSDRGRNWTAWATNCGDATSPLCYAHWMGTARSEARKYMVPDTTGDGFADLVAVDDTGKLVGYHNGSLVNADGRPFANRSWRLDASDWRGYRHLALGDTNNDGYADLVAVGGDGTLYVYPNGTLVNDGGYPYATANWRSAGTWNTMTQFAVGDVTGDGYADIVAVDGIGRLVVYANGSRTNADGAPFANQTYLIGGDWRGVRDLAVTDVNLDGYADIVGVDGDHKLFGYQNGSLVNAGGVPFKYESWRLGDSDWSGVGSITAGDVNGDRYGDLVAFGADGSISVYGNGILLPGANGIPYGRVTWTSPGAWQTYQKIA
ncbi:MAG: VCBS repeat-containing protein [Saccharothrix sp.]|nr:VCBS repeat-containing protein [Saccharothrix sp.]